MSPNKKFSYHILFSLTFIIPIILICCIFLLTEDRMVRLFFIVSALFCRALLFLYYWTFRRSITSFSEQVCSHIDKLIDGETDFYILNEDTLSSKIDMKLAKLQEVTTAHVLKNEKQKQDVQQIVSDISHQLKTPITNLTMYANMVSNNLLPREQELKFLKIMLQQVDKLNFLAEALIKTSRLESNLISLYKEPTRLYDSIAQAIDMISLSAEKKELNIEVECLETLLLSYDPKWTAEAIFNILDNAVKYTPQKGKITVTVQKMELYCKISIEDTGIGIDSEHINDIFKRFYRETAVHKVEGIGIGLYLARQIITQQGGYVTVKSKLGIGSTFSVFLPN